MNETDILVVAPGVRIHDRGMNLTSMAASPSRFLSELRSSLITQSGLIPPGLRWISPAKGFWLFESAPRLQPVIFHNGEAVNDPTAEKLQTYTIMLPWTAMLVELNAQMFPMRTWVFALKGPLTNGGDIIGAMPLPNHYPCGQICYPGNAAEKSQSCHNVADAVNLAKEFAWYSYANEDIFENLALLGEYGQPFFLFRDDYNEYTGPLDDMSDILKIWSATSAERILRANWLCPCDSIKEPEALMRGNTLVCIKDVMNAITFVEDINSGSPEALEDITRQAHARSL